MRKKIRIYGICAASIIFLILVLMGTQLAGVSQEDHNKLMTLHIENVAGSVTLEGWESIDGVVYFFMPSYIDDKCKVTFSELKRKDRLCLDGVEIDAKTNIITCVEWGIPHEMVAYVDGESYAETVVFQKSDNLPAIFIDMEDGALDKIHADKIHKEVGLISIIDENGEVELHRKLEYIKCRGNSTFFDYEKKAYQIKLNGAAEIGDMEIAEKWVLLANAHDDSLIRNAVIFDYGRKYTDIPTSEGMFADLYINSQYMGNYYLCEKMEVGQGRVDITCSDDITGGYILERISLAEYEVETNAIGTQNGMFYRIVSPENPSVEQVDYITEYMNSMELAIYSEDGINLETGKHFSEYLDIESWVDKYLVEEVFSDPDVPAASMFLYKDVDSKDGRIQCGPLWDYDRALGGYAVEGKYYLDAPEQYAYRGLYAVQLLNHDEVYNLVKERYFGVMKPFIEEELVYQVHNLQERLEESAQMDDIRWPEIQGYYAEYDANGEYIIEFAKRKIDYMDARWGRQEQFHTVTFLDAYGNVYEQYSIKHGDYLKEKPYIVSYEAIFSGWTCVESGKTLDLRLPILEDKTYSSTWINAGILVANGLSMADMDLQQVDIDAIQTVVNELKCLKEEGELDEY